MKKLAVIAALCSFAAGCTSEDTNSATVWRRPFEPRVSGMTEWQPCHTLPLEQDHVVRRVRCGRAPVKKADCPRDEEFEGREHAMRVLAESLSCTDMAIAALERYERVDDDAKSDLAAAYYVRAQRDDRPQDFLKAFDKIEEAVKARPNSREAHFNRALIRDQLGLSSTWADVLRLEGSGKWAEEARRKMARPRVPRSVEQWSDGDTMRAALAKRDVKEVARLISAFPLTAQTLLLQEKLSNVDEAGLLAQQISRHLKGDPFFLDVAEKKGDPLRLLRHIAKASDLSFDSDMKRALALLDGVEKEAAARGYKHVLARVHGMRGFFLFNESRYLESNAEYDKALTAYDAMNDTESAAKIRSRIIGNLYTTGQYKQAWREAYRALPYAHRFGELKEQHVALGEIAKAALLLEHPQVALLYQNAAVAVAGDKLPIAVRSRAAIELALGENDKARASVDEAARLLKDQKESAPIMRVLRVRLAEVQGQTAATPQAAIAAFTEALKLTANEKLYTFHSSIYAQRAKIHRQLGDDRSAERDYRDALRALDVEEKQHLAKRNVVPPEDDAAFWNAYFSRFQATYQALIQLLLDQNRLSEAFLLNERAHAYEPLDRILQAPTVPPRFRELDRKNLRTMRQQLPTGTFLLAYAVLPKVTHTWILSANHPVTRVSQRVDADDVKRWNEALQWAVRFDDPEAFEAGLTAPYERLFAEPLKQIRRMSRGDPRRLVIIPDGAMHQLPIAALKKASPSRKYLIEVAPITMAGNMSLYLYSWMRDAVLAPSRDRSMALFADPQNDLEYALKEVNDIARSHPHAIVRRKGQATAAEFLRLVPNVAVAHVAAHAVAEEEAPQRSRLKLAPDGHHSGDLTAGEILDQLHTTRTRVVVLSACQSAGGLPVGAEGVSPLVRPFLVAGVPAVVGSLWPINDATAGEIMVSFYRHYANGHDVAAALQAAQIDMIRHTDRARSSAIAWAPYQVIGYGGSPFGADDQKKEKPP